MIHCQLIEYSNIIYGYPKNVKIRITNSTLYIYMLNV